MTNFNTPLTAVRTYTCNTPEGIETYLTDLAGLNRLAEDRRIAKKNGASLYKFYVMGRWVFDEFAQVAPLGGDSYKAPAELGVCPPVMTPDQLDLFMRGETICSTSGWPFPPDIAICSGCNQSWTLANARDFITDQEHEEVSLEGFEGRQLSDITEIPKLSQVKHFVSHDIIYNDTHPEGAELKRALNGNQWRYVDKDYVVQSGDRVSVQVLQFKHKGCRQKAAELATRAEFERAFAQAGYAKVNLITRKNGYCPCDTCTPWYTAQVAGGSPFVIGWRKRVISVDWSESGVDLSHLFEEETVTKGSHYIHVYGYDKLTEYLTKILPALGAVQ